MRRLALVVAVLAAWAFPAAAGAHPPVVVVVLDEFPSDSMLQPGGRIDAGRFPHFAQLARLSTWYPNATTVQDATTSAVPAILDGLLPHRLVQADAHNHPHSLFRLLHRHGYEMHSTEEFTSLCPYRGCRRLGPHGFFNLVKGDRLGRFGDTLAAIRPRHRPALYFHHVLLPHAPWVYVPSGKRYDRAVADWSEGFASTPGFHDPFLTMHNEQRYMLQVGAVDGLIGRLIQRLRHAGLLRRSAVVVTADHGLSFEVGVRARRAVTRSNFAQVAPVPLFIKAPGRLHGRIDHSLTRTIDVLPTLARMLNLHLPWRVDGRPASSPAVTGRTRVGVIRRDFDSVVRMSGRELAHRRSLDVERRAALFGTGSWSRLYRVGPHQELLSRPVGELPVEDGGPRYRLRGGADLAAVDLRSGYLPSWVAGDVLAGGGPRDLAVALGGRIVATGRSFHLEGRGEEFFSVMVPEGAIRQGRNELELLEVAASGGLRRMTR